MTCPILCGLLALVSVGALGVLPVACQSGGVGDPRTPEDEYSNQFAGFKVSEENIESRSFQCATRICLGEPLPQGRVSSPPGPGRERPQHLQGHRRHDDLRRGGQDLHALADVRAQLHRLRRHRPELHAGGLPGQPPVRRGPGDLHLHDRAERAGRRGQLPLRAVRRRPARAHQLRVPHSPGACQTVAGGTTKANDAADGKTLGSTAASPAPICPGRSLRLRPVQRRRLQAQRRAGRLLQLVPLLRAVLPRLHRRDAGPLPAPPAPTRTTRPAPPTPASAGRRATPTSTTATAPAASPARASAPTWAWATRKLAERLLHPAGHRDLHQRRHLRQRRRPLGLELRRRRKAPRPSPTRRGC